MRCFWGDRCPLKCSLDLEGRKNGDWDDEHDDGEDDANEKSEDKKENDDDDDDDDDDDHRRDDRDTTQVECKVHFLELVRCRPTFPQSQLIVEIHGNTTQYNTLFWDTL